MKWKQRLLSSSLPLEFDVAKILTSLGYSISYEFSYLRDQGESSKEFSFDLLATKYIDLSSDKFFRIVIPIECKHRDPNKKWIFLPEINNDEESKLVWGNALVFPKEFFLDPYDDQHIYDLLDTEFHYGFRGFEVNPKLGEVFDKDIKHGVSQLKYGLTYLLRDAFESALDIDLNHRFFFCPILVTTSELVLVNDQFGIDYLDRIDNFDQIGNEVNSIILHQEISPNLKSHHKEVFSELECTDNESLKKIKTNLPSLNIKGKSIPISLEEIFKGICKGTPLYLNNFYTQTIISNSKTLTELIIKVENAIVNGLD